MSSVPSPLVSLALSIMSLAYILYVTHSGAVGGALDYSDLARSISGRSAVTQRLFASHYISRES